MNVLGIDELFLLGAAIVFDTAAVLSFRVPDERFNVLLLTVPMFTALTIGIPICWRLRSRFYFRSSSPIPPSASARRASGLR